MVVHLTSCISRSAGGLFESVRNLSKSVHAHAEAPVEVLSLEDEASKQDVVFWAPVPVHLYRPIGPRILAYSPHMMADLLQKPPELIHLHGIWQYPALLTWRWAKRTKRPYVVSVHGMLEPHGLTQSRFRKWFALRAYVRRCLESAACLRATSMMEVESIRRFGLKTPVALIPNGVSVPPASSTPGSRPFRRAVVLCRLHPQKGLLYLIRAWEAVRPQGWKLIIAGPDHNGHAAELSAVLQDGGLGDLIQIRGEVPPTEKHEFYQDGDLFILPSLGENFSLVIAEALAHGMPVITTRATPWQELTQYQCGWWVEVGVEPLAAALREATGAAPHCLRAMGERGRKLIETRYNWRLVAKRMVDTYLWILARAERPEFVQ